MEFILRCGSITDINHSMDEDAVLEKHLTCNRAKQGDASISNKGTH